MNKGIFVGGLLIGMLVLGSCASTAPVVLVEQKPVGLTAVPVQPTALEGLPSDALGVYMGTIKYGIPPHTLSPGDTVDTWTELDTTPILGHKIGDPISLRVWNGYKSPVTVTVSWVPGGGYADSIPGTGTCRDSDGEYVIAPELMRDWFVFKTGEYSIPTKTILDMPLALYIPKDTTLKGRYILQVAIVRVPDTSMPMGLVEAYIFKLKLDIE